MNQFGFIFWMLLGCYYPTRFRAGQNTGAFTSPPVSHTCVAVELRKSDSADCHLSACFADASEPPGGASSQLPPGVALTIHVVDADEIFQCRTTYQATVIRSIWDARAIISDILNVV
jgi:hypothetical protein